MTKQPWIIGAIIAALAAMVTTACDAGDTSVAKSAAPVTSSEPAKPDYLRATYNPLHFKPAILTATNDQCLACHKEILEDRVRTSPAGVKPKETSAWYQQLSTYTGEQDTFHRRHLATPLAKQLMNLQCNTCHEGHNPRDEVQGTAADAPAQTETGFTMRKQVNPETTCLKCHGQMPDKNIMGLPDTWPNVKESFQNNCLTCHAAIRTERHKVSYLNTEAIEAVATEKGGDVCYGCHGGRSWYRISYPYPRHAWPDMPAEVPDWAKNRPTESEPRFAKGDTLNRNQKPMP
jgi:nitrate/TMAO reductase-like tetraheme cytochrome c subunit